MMVAEYIFFSEEVCERERANGKGLLNSFTILVSPNPTQLFCLSHALLTPKNVEGG